MAAETALSNIKDYLAGFAEPRRAPKLRSRGLKGMNLRAATLAG